MNVTRNMGADGNTPGRAIRLVDRAVLDTQVPDWHASTPANEVMHYVFDPVNPKVFYVYPRVSSARQIEIVYSASPVDIAIGAVILIDDIYSMPSLTTFFTEHIPRMPTMPKTQFGNVLLGFVRSGIGPENAGGCGDRPERTPDPWRRRRPIMMINPDQFLRFILPFATGRQKLQPRGMWWRQRTSFAWTPGVWREDLDPVSVRQGQANVDVCLPTDAVLVEIKEVVF